MDDSLLEELLHQSEGPTVDFKQQQYRFVKASDREKSELLKDILTFANAWRPGPAYILIGVMDVPGGRSSPIGIDMSTLDADIDDAQLQQFVNTKTNRTIDFQYELYTFEGKTLAIITIPKQARPVYASTDFGLVRKNDVYYRSGSSVRVASPEEIAKMGETDSSERSSDPIIRVEFTNLEQRKLSGNFLELSLVVHDPHDPEVIPDARGRQPHRLIPYDNPLDYVNRDYWRELADYLMVQRMCAPIGIGATNSSSSLAENVRVEITQTKLDGLDFLNADAMPDRPRFKYSPLDHVVDLPSIIHGTKHYTHVESFDDRWAIRVVMGDIQPKSTAWAPEPFFVACRHDCDLELKAVVYANNISQPQNAALRLSVHATETPALTIDDLRAEDASMAEDEE